MTTDRQTDKGSSSLWALHDAPHRIQFDDVWKRLGYRPVAPIFRSVVGHNDLQPVTQDSPVRQAVCAIGSLSEQNEFTLVGTGFLINHRLMVTAGHVIASLIQSDAKTIGIFAGLFGKSLPFPGVAMHRAEMLAQLRLPFGRTSPAQAGSPEDFAALLFSSQGFPRAPELRYRVYDDGELRGHMLTITGYPGTQPSLHIEACYQYEHSGAVSFDAHRIHYYIDTLPGQSGSPIWTLGQDGKPVVVGIHLAGQEAPVIAESSGGQFNWGTRIDSAVAQQLSTWLQSVR